MPHHLSLKTVGVLFVASDTPRSRETIREVAKTLGLKTRNEAINATLLSERDECPYYLYATVMFHQPKRIAVHLNYRAVPEAKPPLAMRKLRAAGCTIEWFHDALESTVLKKKLGLMHVDIEAATTAPAPAVALSPKMDGATPLGVVGLEYAASNKPTFGIRNFRWADRGETRQVYFTLLAQVEDGLKLANIWQSEEARCRQLVSTYLSD